MKKYNTIFPESANNNYKGYNIAKYVFFIIFFTLVRSCIHLFTPDGGAGIIAGLDTSRELGQNLISIFSIWGLSQLLVFSLLLCIYVIKTLSASVTLS